MITWHDSEADSEFNISVPLKKIFLRKTPGRECNYLKLVFFMVIQTFYEELFVNVPHSECS